MSLTEEHELAMLKGLADGIEWPGWICANTDSEFVSKILDTRGESHEVQFVFSCPGKPTDHPLVEEVNGPCLTERVDHHGFAPLAEAQQTIET